MKASIKLIFVAVMFLLIGQVTKASNAKAYDIPRMLSVLNDMKSLAEIPKFETVTADEQDIGLPPSEPSVELVELFKNIQKSIFGRDDLIALKTCEDCGFTAGYFSRTVYITPTEVDRIMNSTYLENPREVLTYIFTHELSHFVHEITTHAPYSEKNFYSINGNLSAYIEDANILMTITPELSFASHSEVDAYASLILKNNGFAGWGGVYKFIDSEIQRYSADQDGDMTKLDFSGRLETIKSIEKTSN